MTYPPPLEWYQPTIPFPDSTTSTWLMPEATMASSQLIKAVHATVNSETSIAQLTSQPSLLSPPIIHIITFIIVEPVLNCQRTTQKVSLPAVAHPPASPYNTSCLASVVHPGVIFALNMQKEHRQAFKRVNPCFIGNVPTEKWQVQPP